MDESITIPIQQGKDPFHAQHGHMLPLNVTAHLFITNQLPKKSPIALISRV